MGRAINIKRGDRFGSWTVLKVDCPSRRGRCALVRCACGREVYASCWALRRGPDERNACSTCRYHKGTNPEFSIWTGMIARCNDTESSLYTNYGGRGIAVCDRWRDSFENFLADMGQRPSRDLSIDRINNDGNYEPGNCRWATRTQQSRNQRSNRHITVGDRTMLLVEWSEATGLSMPTIAGRLKRGWSPQRAISTPVRTKGPRK